MSDRIKTHPAALRLRRCASSDREAGFTLIELLVVVIIIGILAAIAIPVYIGVQNNAKDSAVKSDLVNVKTALVAYTTDNNGNLPASTSVNATTLGKYGYSQSTNTTSLTYTTQVSGTSTFFCVVGLSSTNNKFAITTNTQVAGGTTATACPTSF